MLSRARSLALVRACVQLCTPFHTHTCTCMQGFPLSCLASPLLPLSPRAPMSSTQTFGACHMPLNHPACIVAMCRRHLSECACVCMRVESVYALYICLCMYVYRYMHSTRWCSCHRSHTHTHVRTRIHIYNVGQIVMCFGCRTGTYTKDSQHLHKDYLSTCACVRKCPQRPLTRSLICCRRCTRDAVMPRENVQDLQLSGKEYGWSTLS